MTLAELRFAVAKRLGWKNIGWEGNMDRHRGGLQEVGFPGRQLDDPRLGR